jgi:glucose-1-phosphate cytidylyltransferase
MRHDGLRDFVLCLGYKGHVIKEYFLNYEAMNSDFTISLGRLGGMAYHGEHTEQDFRVTLAETGATTLTAGRVQPVAKYLSDDTFLLTYGDGLADVDIGELLKFHAAARELATLTTVRPRPRYGVVNIVGPGDVTSFSEKPQIDGWVNAGFCVLNKRVLDYIPDEDCMLEREPFEKLAADGQLMAYQHHGFFYAMDTFRDYQHLNELWSMAMRPGNVGNDDKQRILA